jgi:hypothetical protein
MKMLPPKTKQKYLNRIGELIEKGQQIPISHKTIQGRTNRFTGDVGPSTHVTNVGWPQFVEWRTNCVTLLDNIIPANSIHRSTVDHFRTLANKPDALEFGISFLKSIQNDLENEFLGNLYMEIEAELSADYLGQAEFLLTEGTSGKHEHIPAAVLAGAVLEKNLKTLCQQQTPPIDIVNDKGKSLMLNALIDSLKKRNVFNEVQAKQLRAWADIRNSAAHGDFEDFTKDQVAIMLNGIQNFISNYL